MALAGPSPIRSWKQANAMQQAWLRETFGAAGRCHTDIVGN